MVELPNINDTITWPKRCEGKWSLTPSNTDYSYIVNIDDITIEAFISKWYIASRKMFEINGKLRVYKSSNKTTQVEERVYTFALENALNDEPILVTKDDKENYMVDQVAKIVDNMNAILASI